MPLKFVVLEVSRRFVEPEMEQPIVVPVGDVEQLRHGAAAERVLRRAGAGRRVAGLGIAPLAAPGCS